MDARDRTRLITKAVAKEHRTWADLGSGAGAFTLCLAELLGAAAVIAAVDLDAAALAKLERSFARSPAARRGVILRTICGDFTDELDLPPQDGLLLANSLHYVREPVQALRHLGSLLRPGGTLLVVEYESAAANPWVPYPLPYVSLEALAQAAGFAPPALLATAPSRYHGSIYAALSTRP